MTQILIKSFSSESQDQRNIKRRVYDAINVMVSAGHFQKKGESIERTENSLANVRTRGLRKSLDKRIAEREEEAEGKRRKINQLKKRIGKLKELVSRNRANLAKHSLRIYSPRIVVTGDFAPSLSKNGRTLTLLAAGGKSKGKRATNKDILIL